MGEGDIAVRIWFGAPMMHSMSGPNLAWHSQVRCGHVHLSSHCRIVGYGGWLFNLHVLVRVKDWVFLLACNVWVVFTLLCHAIHSPFNMDVRMLITSGATCLCCCCDIV